MAHPHETLKNLGISARKRFSQNFLCSPHWRDKLIAALEAEAPYSSVWEIGPGLGALTERLRELPYPLRVFEIDRGCAAYLRERWGDLDLVEGDFLNYDLEAHLSPGETVGVLSNLPYHLSSPILFRLMERCDRFPCLVLTFQKEFAERLVAEVGTKAYGALSVLVQSVYAMRSLGILSPGSFYPVPDVSSQALLFKPKASIGFLSTLSPLVKAAFKHRRKMALKNLSLVYPKKIIVDGFSELNLSLSVRPEQISPQQYIQLSQLIDPAGREC